jgi:DNA-binding NarL/FixJ family response regulator
LQKRKKRTPYKEQPLADAVAELEVMPEDVTSDVAGMLEKLAEVVRSVHERAIEILELSVEGLGNAEIASKLDLGIRTVQVIKQKMHAAWIRYEREEEL